jgi:hypothetical protein
MTWRGRRKARPYEGEFGPGAFAGYGVYRRSPAPPKKRHKPIYVGDQREHIIQRTIDLMRDWRSTPFEFEGTARYAIRATLCADGFAWSQADDEAAQLTSAALNRMGATRPTYEQGQREYLIPNEDCSWCQRPIDPTMLTGQFSVRFCSEICGRAALRYRDYETSYRNEFIWRSLTNTIRREDKPTRACKSCGVIFRPAQEDGEFCSVRCVGRHNREIPDRPCKSCGTVFRPRESSTAYCSVACANRERAQIPERDCAECGTRFRPGSERSAAAFCSAACYQSHGALVRHELECRWCQASFTSSRRHSLWCSSTCSNSWHSLKRGHSKRVVITPPIFDHLMRMAA